MFWFLLIVVGFIVALLPLFVIAAFLAQQASTYFSSKLYADAKWMIQNQQYTTVPSVLSSTSLPVISHSVIMISFLITWLLMLDSSLCNLDYYLTKNNINELFNNAKSHNDLNEKLGNTKNHNSSIYTLKAWNGFVSIDLSGKSLPARILRSASLPIEWSIWLYELLWSSSQPRSVFTVVQKLLKPDTNMENDDPKVRLIEYAIVFAGIEEVKEIVETATDNKESQLPRFGPKHFDSIRQQLLTSQNKVIDLTRATYSGFLNLFILIIAVHLISVCRVRHLFWKRIWEEQMPHIGDRIQANHNQENAPALIRVSLSWTEFWQTKNLDIWSPLLVATEQYAKRSSQFYTGPIVLTSRMLTRLSQMKSFWNGEQRLAIYETISEFQEQAQKALAKTSPNNSPRTKNFPELMTQLGFLGTIVGIIIGMSSAALTQVPSVDPLYRSMSVGEMLAGLSVAFSTTLLGLISAMILNKYIMEWGASEDDMTTEGTTLIADIFRTEYAAIFEI